MLKLQPRRWNRYGVVIVLAVTALLGAGCGSSTKTSVKPPVSGSTTAGPAASFGGSAYGYYSKISLFGGPAAVKGPTPTVTLPAGGSSTPVTQSVPSEDLTYGPAHVFDSGSLKISTQGTPASGTVTSSTSIQGCTAAITNGCNVGEVFAGPFTAKSVSATCTAKGSSHTATVKIKGGQLSEEAANAGPQGPPGPPIKVPADPGPNYTVTATFPDTGKVYKYVFNEQTVDANGALTVNAGHEYLNAASAGAQGDLIFGQTVCGK